MMKRIWQRCEVDTSATVRMSKVDEMVNPVETSWRAQVPEVALKV